jgi:hypothetical protein
MDPNPPKDGNNVIVADKLEILDMINNYGNVKIL